MCERHEAAERKVRELEAALAQITREHQAATTAWTDARAQCEGFRPRAAAADRLAAALEPFVSVGQLAGVVDQEAIVQQVLARLPATGGAPLTVTPPAKLRADFQREEVDRTLAAIRALKPLAKRILRLVEALEGACIFQKAIAERLGRATGGGSWIDLTTAVKELGEAGYVEVDAKRGVRTALRTTLAARLAVYQPTEADVEAVYQAVLHAVATEDA